jgi:hypothetical protein
VLEAELICADSQQQRTACYTLTVHAIYAYAHELSSVALQRAVLSSLYDTARSCYELTTNAAYAHTNLSNDGCAVKG